MIEYLPGKFLFPQNVEGFRKIKGGYIFRGEAISNGQNTNGLFPPTQTDYLINDSLLEYRGDMESIVENVLDRKAISHESIIACYNNELSKLKKREKQWGIKVSKFIEDNYRFKRLFYDHEHPSEYMIVYMVNQLLGVLGINQKLDDCLTVMNGFSNPIYPCTIEALKLDYDRRMYGCVNRLYKLSNKEMDITEYIKEYCWNRYISKEKRIILKIKELIRKHHFHEFAIAPYGEMGEYIENIIKREFEDEANINLYIDNKKTGKDIFSIENAPIEGDGLCILISTIKGDIASVLYEEILEKVPAKRIVHVFDSAGW